MFICWDQTKQHPAPQKPNPNGRVIQWYLFFYKRLGNIQNKALIKSGNGVLRLKLLLQLRTKLSLLWKFHFVNISQLLLNRAKIFLTQCFENIIVVFGMLAMIYFALRNKIISQKPTRVKFMSPLMPLVSCVSFWCITKRITKKYNLLVQQKK